MALSQVIAQRVPPVDDVIRVVPVQQRIVEAHFQAPAAESLDIRRDQVLAIGRIGDFVIGVGAVPQAEAFVMLGGQHDVFHPGIQRALCPQVRVVAAGIEMIEINAILFNRDLFAVAHPLVAGGQRIQPPVNKHPEAIMDKPLRITGGGSGLPRGGHLLVSSM